MAFIIVIIFEVILTRDLRIYIFSHTTSESDVELGAKLFRHLLALPVSYFENRRGQEAVARVRELEQISNFLTGQALTSVLDLFFSVIFFCVMWYYSPQLTLVILLSLPCYVIWSLFISPLYVDVLMINFSGMRKNQAFLVEMVTAMNTIRSMAVSPRMIATWDKQLAGYVASSFRVNLVQ
ncbi:ABC transporter transmembrane domain-containing protein [Escherichia coli]